MKIRYQVYNISKFSCRELSRFVFNIFISKLNNLVKKLASLLAVDLRVHCLWDFISDSLEIITKARAG